MFQPRIGREKEQPFLYEQEGRSVALVDATGSHGDEYYLPQLGLMDSDNHTPFLKKTNTTGYSATAYDEPRLKKDYALLFFSRLLLEHRSELILPTPYWAADPTVEKVKIPVNSDGLYEHHLVLVPRDVNQDYRENDVRFVLDINVKPFGGRIEQLSNGNWTVLEPETFFNNYDNNQYGLLPRARPVLDTLIPQFRKGITDLASMPLEAELTGAHCPVSKYEEQFIRRSLYLNGIIGASHLKEYENVKRITKGIRLINERK